MTELAILFTASWWQSQAEWQIHKPIARSTGLSEPIIEALRQQTLPQFTNEDELLVYRLGKTLDETRRIDDALYAHAIQSFGDPAVVELIGVFGYYAFVAMTLNVFSVRRDSDTPLPFVEPPVLNVPRKLTGHISCVGSSSFVGQPFDVSACRIAEHYLAQRQQVIDLLMTHRQRWAE